MDYGTGVSEIDAEAGFSGCEGTAAELPSNATDDMVDLLMSCLSDGLDNPKLWSSIPDVVRACPDILGALGRRLESTIIPDQQMILIILVGMCHAASGHAEIVLVQLESISARYSQVPLMQGAIFYLNGLLDPTNPKYNLSDRVCRKPFTNLDVLENGSYLCCSSFLPKSVGNLQSTPWENVWNSDQSQSIRKSIHDGSYRYCNKMTCPEIQGNILPLASEIAAESDFFREIVESKAIKVDQGPHDVNLAYDKTCNLSCPSCRIEAYAADSAQRAVFDELQEKRILPLLKTTKSVYVTGSGDPFASKNFRRLLTTLEDEAYDQLRFKIMTNGMLLTPKQWANFPVLHGRTSTLHISIDAAKGATHEKLRRGSRWSTMMENMTFAGKLFATGQVSFFGLTFTVQSENFEEMGDTIDLARQVGANNVYFGRLTNWGTYSAADYESRAPWLKSHPYHHRFLKVMQDKRLHDPLVNLGDLRSFAEPAIMVPMQFQ